MNLVEYARSQVDSFLSEVLRIRETQFPYQQTEDVVNVIDNSLKRHRDYLDKITPTTDPLVAASNASAAVSAIEYYLPILGFILRSTNVRNAFEIHNPLLRLARTILGADTKLILSSEWDASPFIYLDIDELPKFVFIGFPAPESSNPLLIPLAGHELGHSIWNERGCRAKWGNQIEQYIVDLIKSRWNDYQKHFQNIKQEDLATDLLARQSWLLAYEWALKNIEESFCDFVGLKLFATSFLHAAAYVLAPIRDAERPREYPNTTTRIRRIIHAATSFNVDVPPDYLKQFEDLQEPVDDKEVFVLSLADAASQHFIQQLAEEAAKILDDCGVGFAEQAATETVYNSFVLAVPGSEIKSIFDILNAAWKMRGDLSVWDKMPQITNKESFLKELVLKSIEVYEYEQLIGASA